MRRPLPSERIAAVGKVFVPPVWGGLGEDLTPAACGCLGWWHLVLRVEHVRELPGHGQVVVELPTWIWRCAHRQECRR